MSSVTPQNTRAKPKAKIVVASYPDKTPQSLTAPARYIVSKA